MWTKTSEHRRVIFCECSPPHLNIAAAVIMNLLELPLDVLRICFRDIDITIAVRKTCKRMAEFTGTAAVELHASGPQKVREPLELAVFRENIYEFYLFVDGRDVDFSYMFVSCRFMHRYALYSLATGVGSIPWCVSNFESNIMRAAQFVKHISLVKLGATYIIYVDPADVLAGLCWVPAGYGDIIWRR